METTTSTEKAKVETMDDIAHLLAGEPEQTEEIDGQDEETEESTEHSEKGQDEGEGEDEDEDEESKGDEEITWGKALGIDDNKLILDDEGNVKAIKVKVDGEESSVQVKDLIAGYQSNKSNTVKSQQLAEQRKEFEAVRNFTVGEYTKKLEDIGKLNTYLEQNLIREYQGINWEQLRFENPGEYAAKVQDFQLRQMEIQNIQKVIGEERQKELEVLQNTQKESFQSYLKGQYAKVLENNPTWSDTKVFKETLSKFQNFIENSYGFTKEDFANIQDARIFEVLKDAMAYREGRMIAQNKLSQPVAKFQKPGTGKPAPKLSKLERLTTMAKAAPPGQKKRDLEASAIAQILLGG